MSWLVSEKDDWLAEEKTTPIEKMASEQGPTLAENIPADVEEPLHRLPEAPPCKIRM